MWIGMGWDGLVLRVDSFACSLVWSLYLSASLSVLV